MNISLDVEGGSRVAVNPSTGVVSFQTGDKIYVAYNGSYVGTLEHNGTNFTGNITATPDGEKYLYFYFVGNKTPNSTPTTSMVVDIYDQTSGEYPVISAASSNEYFSTSTYTYTATLLNKCALVKFNVTTSLSAPIVIEGVNDRVTITFDPSNVGTFTNSQNKGFIKLAANEETGVEEERWAIMLPQDAVSSHEYTSGYCAFTCDDIPEITDNDYLSTGIDVTCEALEGVVPGLFTINASGDQVIFANGNVENNSGTYSFAATQWTDHSGNPTLNGNYFNNTQAQAAVTGLNGANYLGHNTWKLLSSTEWSYVCETRTAVDGSSGREHNIKMVTVSDLQNALYSLEMQGFLIFPDGYTQGPALDETLTTADLERLTSEGVLFLPLQDYMWAGVIQYPTNTQGTYYCTTTNKGYVHWWTAPGRDPWNVPLWNEQMGDNCAGQARVCCTAE